MTNSDEDYSFLNNVDHKVLIFTAVLTIALTGGAFLLNKIAKEDCRVTDYIYCGVEKIDHH